MSDLDSIKEVNDGGCLRRVSNVCLVQPVEGLDAWLMLLRVCLVYVILGISQISLGIYLLEFTEHFHVSMASVAFIASARFLTKNLLGLFTSAFIQNYGCRTVAICGGVFYFVSLFTSVYAPSLQLLYVTLGLVSGVGSNLSVQPTQVLMIQYFTRNRGLGNGLRLIGFSIGMVIGPLLVYQLIEEYGWRGSLLLQSGLAAHMIPLAMTFRPPRREFTEPILPRDYRPLALRLRRLLRDICDFSLLKKPVFVVFCVGCLLKDVVLSPFSQHLPKMAVHRGISKRDAAVLVSIYGIASFITRVATTFISNIPAVNRTIYMGVGCVLSGLASVALSFVLSFYGMAIAAALVGISSGCVNTPTVVVLVDLVGVTLLARSLSLLNIFLTIPSVMATPFIGWLFDVTGKYTVPYIFAACAGLLASLFIFLASFLVRLKRKNASTQHDEAPVERSDRPSVDGEHILIHASEEDHSDKGARYPLDEISTEK